MKKYIRALRAVQKLLDSPPTWWYLRNDVGGLSKVTTWATEERAQEVANSQGKPARVVPLNGRFAVQVFS